MPGTSVVTGVIKLGYFASFCALVLLWAAALGGCGIGLCVAGSEPYCLGSGPSSRLLVSGLDLSVRRNLCYPVSLSAVDSQGSVLTNITSTVTFLDSSEVGIYASELGCQTYDEQDEKTVFLLTPSIPQVSFYVRFDAEGAFTLNASASGDSELVALSQPLTVESFPFAESVGPSSSVQAIAQVNASMTYVGGSFQAFHDIAVRYIARIGSDGSLDKTFAPTGTGLNAQVLAVAVQSDGKVVVGGSFTSYNGTAAPYVARLNSDGSLDIGFTQTGSGVNAGPVRALVIQSDGKILLGGDFVSYNATSRPYVLRLNSDGSLDSSFATTGAGLNGAVYALFLQSDGGVLVGGNFTTYHLSAAPYLARLNSDGTLDGTFAQTGTGLDDRVFAIVRQIDGRFLIGGDFSNYHLTSSPSVARLNANGTLDGTFAQTGSGINNWVATLALQSDGKVIAGGRFTAYNGASRPYLVRLNADGTIDSAFVSTGTGLDDRVNALLLQSDGQVLVAGDFTAYHTTSRHFLLRLKSDGNIDSDYLAGEMGINNWVHALATGADGKSVVGGRFTLFDDSSRPYVMRVTSEGALDSSFSPTGTGLNGLVRAIALDSNGKTVVGGDFTAYNGASQPYVARINSDGSLDIGFAPTGSGLNGPVHTLAIQADGKILVGGEFTSYHVSGRAYVARLNSDGSLDPSFVHSGSGLNSFVYSLLPLPDGKILVGGDFVTYNAISRSKIARLNSDGTLDATFTLTGSGLNGDVLAIATQSDGKIWVGGEFTQYHVSSRPYLARLESDGSLDSSFLFTGTGLNNFVHTIALQSNGKGIVGGAFTTYDTSTRLRIARINSNGELDSTFASSAKGFTSTVRALNILPIGKIVAGGSFPTHGDFSIKYLTRLTYIGTLD